MFWISSSFFLKQSFKSILPGSETPALVWLLSFLLLLIIITITGIRASRHIRISHENVPFSFGKIIPWYFPVRILFLCSYELFFRGFLIFWWYSMDWSCKQVYGGTKSYIYFFSKSLKRELYNDNVHVSVVCPGAMNTNPVVTSVIKNSSWLVRSAVISPEQTARIAINGLLKKKEVIIPGRLNKFWLLINALVPSFLQKIITNSHMKTLNSVRQENMLKAGEIAIAMPPH